MSDMLCALEEIAAPIGREPEIIDGDSAYAVIQFWRDLAIRYREVAAAAIKAEKGFS